MYDRDRSVLCLSSSPETPQRGLCGEVDSEDLNLRGRLSHRRSGFRGRRKRGYWKGDTDPGVNLDWSWTPSDPRPRPQARSYLVSTEVTETTRAPNVSSLTLGSDTLSRWFAEVNK